MVIVVVVMYCVTKVTQGIGIEFCSNWLSNSAATGCLILQQLAV